MAGMRAVSHDVLAAEDPRFEAGGCTSPHRGLEHDAA